ncbi:MAG: hypothetical protein HQK76_10805 [Desulfobacterales bacterium]|nr:hypothetical protein [Desulfobacterales bacterium]
MIDILKKIDKNVLLLDIGNVFSKINKSESQAKLILDSMELMDYSCMTLSPTELNIGINTLNSLLSNVSFPIITSNLVYKEDNRPFKERYIIKNFGNISIGMIGILPEYAIELISDQKLKKTLIVIPPEKEVEKILSEIRNKVDIIILLSQCGYDKTVSLINNLKGIDIAISGHKFLSTCSQTNDETNLFQLKTRGSSFDFIRMFKDKSGNLYVSDRKSILLDDNIPSDEKILKMMKDANIIEPIKNKNELEKELNKQLQLTPEGFMKLMLEQQKGVNK